MPNEALVPRAHAANGYELLEQVIDAIRAEPKRFWMGDWLSRSQPGHDPACGTVGCIAGWTAVLGRAKDETVKDLLNIQVSQRALDLLFGPLEGKVNADYHSRQDARWDLYDNLFVRTYSEYSYGTPEYVEHFVERIRGFMAKYETLLKANHLPLSTAHTGDIR